MSKDNSSIIKLIVFLIIAGSFLGYYLSQPRPEKLKRPTFEESLEKRKEPVYVDNVTVRKSVETQIQQNTSNVPVSNTPTYESIQQYTAYDYDVLLDSLAIYPSTNIQSVQIIVNKLLKFKGYPEGTVQVIEKNQNNKYLKFHENYDVVNFDFYSGYMTVNSKSLFGLRNKDLIAILEHELDHFDKLANTCKYMGAKEFNNLFYQNNIYINSIFWEKASKFAKGKDFNSRLYEEALKLFIKQEKPTNLYSELYKMSENKKNPFETSADKAEEYVYNHYKIKHDEGPIKRLIDKFDNVNTSVSNYVKRTPGIQNEEIAIFDYYFAQAILSKMPQFNNLYNNCVKNRNGDMTNFWDAYKSSLNKFYKKEAALDKETYDKIYDILDETERQIKTPLSKEETAQALKFRINTLISNLVYPNATKDLSVIIKDYLKFIKKSEITDNVQELKCILLLLCMENDLTTIHPNSEISLYDLVFPEEITSLYEIEDVKKGRYMFIFNNPAFQSGKPENKPEQDYLIDLLNKNRIDIRINK